MEGGGFPITPPVGQQERGLCIMRTNNSTSCDCLLAMFTELRAQLPPLPDLVSDGDARSAWLSAMRGVIQALPTRQQRAAAVIQLADDLVTLRYPGMPLSMAVGWLCGQFGIAPEDMILEDEGGTR